MTRLNVVLVALLVACSLALVTSQHRARRLFVDAERSAAQARQLETAWNELRVQQTALAKAALIDARARRDLAMQAVAPDRTLHLIVDPETRMARLATPVGDGSRIAAATGARPAARKPGGQR